MTEARKSAAIISKRKEHQLGNSYSTGNCLKTRQIRKIGHVV